MRRNVDPQIKKDYMNWLLTPPGEREPSSKKAFAEENDVAYRTLFNWEEEEDFQKALATIKAKWGARWHGDIIGRLMEIVQTGSDSAAVSASKVLLSHLRIPDDQVEQEDLPDDVRKSVRDILIKEGFKIVE